MGAIRQHFNSVALAIAIIAAGLISFVENAQAETKKEFKIAWTIYAGWMPWEYGGSKGIVDKWAKKYGINIEVVQVNDYVESINLYTAGEFDGVTATNMDALTIPAASGVDTTALIVGDFSNGNDGVVLKGVSSLAGIKGQSVNLVELSVSHYLLARALESVGLSEKDITVVNTSDADLVATFASPEVTAAVTWNPLLSEIAKAPNAQLVFDSAKIPGEIIDLLIVNSAVLKDNPNFGKALTGAWYEIMGHMTASGPQRAAAIAHMAAASGTDVPGFEAQLKATRMFYNASDAARFARSSELKETMTKVAQFSFDHGLLGEGARSANSIGIQIGDGSVLGNPAPKLRFNAEYMNMAATNQL